MGNHHHHRVVFLVPDHGVERDPPDWPQLLHLYSRLKSGTTVLEWMEEHDVSELGIDVRRFTSFGVVKVLRPAYCEEGKDRSLIVIAGRVS